MALYNRQTIHWKLNIGDLVGFTKNPFLENNIDDIFKVNKVSSDGWKADLELVSATSVNVLDPSIFALYGYIYSSSGSVGKIVKIDGTNLYLKKITPSFNFKELDTLISKNYFYGHVFDAKENSYIDWSNGNFQICNMTSDITSFINGAVGKTYTLAFTSGGSSCSFPLTVAIPPNYTIPLNTVTFVDFICTGENSYKLITLDKNTVSTSVNQLKYVETGFIYKNQPTKGFKKIKLNPIDSNMNYLNDFLL